MLGGLATMALRATRPDPVPETVHAVRRAYPATLDPSRMSARELRRLPGIGRKRALAILEARRAAEAADVPLTWTDVHGIGETTDRRVRAWLEDRGADPEAPLRAVGDGTAP